MAALTTEPLKQLPKPTWHGFTDPNLVVKYLEFASNGHRERVERELRSLRSTLSSGARMKTLYTEQLSSCRISITENTEELKALQAQLVDISTTELAEAALLELISLNYVIGLRANSSGRLVVHIRLFKPLANDAKGYMGDFEITLYARRSLLGGEHVIRVARTQAPATSPDWKLPYAGTHATDGVMFGNFGLGSIDCIGLITAFEIVELVDQIVARLLDGVQPTDHWDTEPQFAPTWEGIAPNMVAALLRSVDQIGNEGLRLKIQATQKALDETKSTKSYLTRELRQLHLSLSKAQAQLNQLEAAGGATQAFDEDAAKAELRFMTTLPGVMGMKFTPDGIPVFHLRTFYESREGTVYDMGDFELTFRPNWYDSYGVVAMRRTRSSGGRHLYFNRSREEDGWFCFGHRAEELKKSFDQGAYGSFFHVALNSMNSINDGSTSYLRDYYPPILRELIWRPTTGSRGRARRRGRLGQAVLRAML